MRSRGLVALVLTVLAFPCWATNGESNVEMDEYRLGAEDVIRIQAWGRVDLTTDAVLDESGKVSLPLVGAVEAAGRTPADLGRYLTDRYQLIDQQITEILVTVLQYNNRSVTVVGEVRNPGKLGFRVIPGLWDVLLKAGGATPTADLSNVQVVHGAIQGGVERTVTVDLSRGIDQTDPNTLPILEPKDTVIVPTTTDNAVSGDKFQVLGFVRNPGSYKIQSDMTVVDAVSAAGGQLPDADLSKALLTRPGPHGASSYTLDLKRYLEDGQPPTNMLLKPGDTISIPQRHGTWTLVYQGILAMTPIVTLVTAIVSLATITHW
jgi:polysaccharide biosynthesis/export protein